MSNNACSFYENNKIKFVNIHQKHIYIKIKVFDKIIRQSLLLHYRWFHYY